MNSRRVTALRTALLKALETDDSASPDGRPKLERARASVAR